jgi:hypothetical protein
MCITAAIQLAREEKIFNPLVLPQLRRAAMPTKRAFLPVREQRLGAGRVGRQIDGVGDE